jgi:hypothetical protein
MRDPAIGGNKALVFPPWFPPYLEPEACRVYAKALDLGFKSKVAMVERLVSDFRMQRVWRELSELRRDRDYRGTDIFEHQATPPSHFRRSGVRNLTIQQTAIRELFYVTANSAQCFELLSESGSIERATELRADAGRLQEGRPRKTCSAFAKKLIAAAEAYEHADRLKPLSRARLVQAVTEIAAFMKERFGSTMHTLTATLASVALNLKITPSNVREWVGRNRPAKRRAKSPLGKNQKTSRFSQRSNRAS